MSREIKYKYYFNTDNDEPILSKTATLRQIELGKAFNGILGWSSPEPIRCQYTGLNDKNGTPIYEGDIVDIHSKIAHTKTIGGIFYEEKVCAFIVDDSAFRQHIPMTATDEIEVIGNIYESPELLE